MSHKWFIPMASLAAVVAVTLFGVAKPAEAQEEEVQAVTDKSHLTFEYQALRMIAPKTGAKKGRLFWYMLYTLENKTGEDQEFFISIRARTDAKRTYGDVFLPTVERAIERKEGMPLWGPTNRFEVLAKRDPEDGKYNYMTIKAGEKRRCVAVFNTFDPHATKVHIRVAGLYPLDVVTGEDGKPSKIQERVRVLEFHRKGDDQDVASDSFRLKNRRWDVDKVPLVAAGAGDDEG